MIAFPSSVRVWLAAGRTDMRRYVESPVMRSAAPEASIALICRAKLLRIILASYQIPLIRTCVPSRAFRWT
jgi:hypothetical protein